MTLPLAGETRTSASAGNLRRAHRLARYALRAPGRNGPGVRGAVLSAIEGPSSTPESIVQDDTCPNPPCFLDVDELASLPHSAIPSLMQLLDYTLAVTLGLPGLLAASLDLRGPPEARLEHQGAVAPDRPRARRRHATYRTVRLGASPVTPASRSTALASPLHVCSRPLSNESLSALLNLYVQRDQGAPELLRRRNHDGIHPTQSGQARGFGRARGTYAIKLHELHVRECQEIAFDPRGKAS